MVMSVLINKDGKVCITHDSYYEGHPVSLHYAAVTKILTLHMDNGQKAQLGSATLPEISQRLECSSQVLIMQIRRPDPTQQFKVPLLVHTN